MSATPPVNPSAQLATDAKALVAQGVQAAKDFADAIMGDVSKDVPQYQGDVLNAASLYIESVLPANVGPTVSAFLSAGESMIPFTQLDAKVQASIALLQKSADNFLATL